MVYVKGGLGTGRLARGVDITRAEIGEVTASVLQTT